MKFFKFINGSLDSKYLSPHLWGEGLSTSDITSGMNIIINAKNEEFVYL